MKRMHVHVAVDDLKQSIDFYSALFAARPSVSKVDYVRSSRTDRQASILRELNEVYARLYKAGGNVIEQGQTTCCYAESEKSWIDDPSGISWETFLTTGESTDYGDGSGERVARVAHEKSCCAPQEADPASACSCSAA